MLSRRAREQPDERAYLFLPDRGGEPAAIGFAKLEARAAAVARRLARRGDKGDRALLLFPPGIDFIVGFFGCLMAGIIAVPMMLPRRYAARDASDAVAADCAPRFAMTTGEVLNGPRADIVERFRGADLEWVAVDDEIGGPAAADAAFAMPDPADTAFLQYTSGSTSAPKGVVATHASVVANLEMIRGALGNTRRSTHVSWVPHYHDMGLVLNLLQSLYVGAACVLLAPVSFMRRPLLWLRAIHAHRAEVATAPNFAYALCVARYRAEEMAGIDLSGWKVALNGAEPVRGDTLQAFAQCFAPHGFAAQALYPAYGMAEATLLISGGRRGAGAVTRHLSRAGLQRGVAALPAGPADAQIAVGCGRALAGERLAIVEPESRRPLPPGRIGEIWVAGPNVAAGYWRNPEATAATFGAETEGGDAGPWLRTGDLGFLGEDGELFITGRIKDVVIIRGANHYPQDIEATVEGCHPALAPHACAAFGDSEAGEAERLVIVQEIDRLRRRGAQPAAIVEAIREAVIREHDIAPHEIVLIRPGGLPMTTSGKVQRRRARQLWLAGELDLFEPSPAV